MVKRTAGRTVVRRSSSGASRRGSVKCHRTSTTAAVPDSARAVPEVRPQSPALVMGSRKRTRHGGQPGHTEDAEGALRAGRGLGDDEEGKGDAEDDEAAAP